MTDLNAVTAGEYELVAVMFDQVTSKPGEPLDYKRYRAGDIVTLDVEDARRLVKAGAVVEPGARQRAAAEAARAQYEAALAALPDAVRAELAAGGEVTQVGLVDDPDPVVPDPPAKSANKGDWVAFAVARGMTEAEAKKLNKDELIARLTVGDNDGDQGGSQTGSEGGGQDGDSGQDGDGDEGDGGTPSTLPLITAPHEQWVQAAVDREVDREEAEAMTTQELQDLLT